jgi:hypothetical protein
MKCKFHKNCFTTVLRIFGDFNDSLVMGKKNILQHFTTGS